VYFLIEGTTVVYIGQTRNLAARLLQHTHTGKKWERVLFIPVPVAELLRVEAEWIAALQPPLNRCAVTRSEKETV
jgi:hypothetical protein